jgi:Arc/MetJ-type ribon-helix-helix transcriptional regulator
MAIEVTKEQQQVIDLAIASGAFQSPGEVIETALAMLFRRNQGRNCFRRPGG